jgi:thiol:disulfide interchange protein
MLSQPAKFSLIGFILGLGSPAGWILIRLIIVSPDNALDWIVQELQQSWVLYLYITIGTTLSFSLFGYFAGHLIQKFISRLFEP